MIWIPTDPWPKHGGLKRRKHLPEEDTSTDVWYLDRYDQYLERPIAAIPIKYPDYYRYYRRTQREPGGSAAIASNLAEDFAYDSPSSESHDAPSGDRFQAHVRPDEGERPYWWPSPLEKLEKTFTDEVGKKWILRRRTAIPRWNFYLPYAEDADLYFLQKMLLSQPFTKADHERKFLSSNNVTKTYREECIHRGLFRGYEEEARGTLNNAQARGYSVERLRLLAQVLMAEEIIDSTFLNTYMSDLDELENHCFGEDEPEMAEEAELDPQLAEELRAFMDADDTGAAEALVNALNQGQRRVFDIFIAHFQRQTLDSGPDISQHCRTSNGNSVRQLCVVLTGVAGTGKSYVVRLLIAKLRALGFGILVCGASRVAALNVGGHTIHSLYSLSLDLEL